VGKYVLQIPADDGCVYTYDAETNRLYRVCEVKQENFLPEAVKETLEKAHLTVKWPS
jgi:hypothetical protein